MIRVSYVMAIALALTLGGLLPSAGRAQERATDQGAILSRGAELFSRNCQRCHNPRGPAEWSDREWVIVMQHMATRAYITGDRMRAIRTFLLASNEAARSPGEVRGATAVPSPEEVTEAMLAEGRTVFLGAGGCAACHGADLGGGPIAPDLRDPKWKNGDGSLATILSIVRNGVAGSAMAPYPGGISDEMAVKVAAYVWAVGQGRTQP